MRTIIKIARNELLTLFYSPVAWFALIVFLIVCASISTNLLDYVTLLYWAEAGNNPAYQGIRYSLTRALTESSPFYPTIIQNLYFFVPLLTMGLVSREVNQGTIRLLYSTPTKLWQVICGKYLGICIFSLMLVLIVSIFHGVAIYSIVNVEIGVLLSSLLGFYLLLCAYSAIGLFMSCLTHYQVVAAIATFIALFVLQKINGLWQEVEIVRDITWFLSMGTRLENMLKGLITSKDVLYFMLVSAMFVFMAYLVLLRGRKHALLALVITRFVVLIAVVLGIGYVIERPAFVAYYDASKNKDYTIHQRTQQLLKQMDGPLEVTLYCNVIGENAKLGVPGARNNYLSKLWEPYLRFKPGIQFKYVYYYKPVNRVNPYKTVRQFTQEIAQSYRMPFSILKTPAEIDQIINLRWEEYRLVMQAKYKGCSVFLRTYDAGSEDKEFPSEIHVAAMLNTLLKGKAIQVVSLTGELERHFEPGDRHFGKLSTIKTKLSLLNLGFEFSYHKLDEGDVPKDADIVVLADPKIELSPLAQSRLSKYIAGGGNMLVLGEPGKQHVVNPVLEPLGLKLQEGILVYPQQNQPNDQIPARYTDTMLSLTESPGLQMLKQQRAFDVKYNPNERDINLILYGAAPFADSSLNRGFTPKVLLEMVPQGTWLKAGNLVADSTAPDFNAAEGDRKEPLDALKAYTRMVNGHEQRIVVAGDADFMSDLRSVTGCPSDLLSWLSGGKTPVYLPRPSPGDQFLRVTSKEAKTFKIVLLWIIPAVLTLLAAILLIRRKRR